MIEMSTLEKIEKLVPTAGSVGSVFYTRAMMTAYTYAASRASSVPEEHPICNQLKHQHIIHPARQKDSQYRA
jgi:hypothetical protein